MSLEKLLKENPKKIIPSYINAFVGYSHNIYNRLHGSSGGVGTSVLQFLLDTKTVDAVIGVGFDEKDKTKAIYKIIEQSSRVTELTGSKYVYMPLNSLLDLIFSLKDKKIAVVTEPCFVNGIRKVAPNCTYIISFFCGYNITKEATDYLIKKIHIPYEDIHSIDYRGGEYPGGFTVHTKKGTSKSFKKEHYELVDLLFLREQCSRCKVFISNTADIVLGDAWIKNIKNVTLLLTNTSKGDHILEQMYKKNLISLYDIEASHIIKMHPHNLRFKNYGHSKFMEYIIFLLNNKIAQEWAPFHFLGWVSKIRRAFMYGIHLDLQPTQKYDR